MVEPMDIDQNNGVHEQATPDESITEQSSIKGEDTPESTDVIPRPRHLFLNELLIM
jgi:hypothetical protein